MHRLLFILILISDCERFSGMRPPIRAARALPRHLPVRPACRPAQSRTLFSWLRGTSESSSSTITPLSSSPHPALVQKADRIKAASLCPTSYEKYGERVRPAFDCPDCGWPTHKDQERWSEGLEEHKEYCGRLKEVNTDEHDIRSGRKMKEFEDMPGTLQSI